MVEWSNKADLGSEIEITQVHILSNAGSRTVQHRFTSCPAQVHILFNTDSNPLRHKFHPVRHRFASCLTQVHILSNTGSILSDTGSLNVKHRFAFCLTQVHILSNTSSILSDTAATCPGKLLLFSIFYDVISARISSHVELQLRELMPAEFSEYREKIQKPEVIPAFCAPTLGSVSPSGVQVA
ncbi:hypothetical protein J6590_031904 [Homalodisca vitripennis]|nr:hypothetical protein J6590_031904 [Homalodisca vitripennis]